MPEEIITIEKLEQDIKTLIQSINRREALVNNLSPFALEKYADSIVSIKEDTELKKHILKMYRELYNELKSKQSNQHEQS